MQPRKVLWIAISILVALVFSQVIGEFFVELAREDGLYESPSRKIERVMNGLRWLLDQAWFWASFWFVCGAATGAWLGGSITRW